MEMKEIYDCQEVLEFVTEIKTEEERQCNQLFKNPDTLIWLKERRGYLDKEIKAIERKVSEGEANQDIKEKKKAQEAINTKINELENNKKELVIDLDKIPHEIFYQIDCSGVDFSKVTTPPRCGTIETAVHKDLKAKIAEIECGIKKYDSDIYDKEQSQYKLGEDVKNKESNILYWEGKVNDARREVNYAENDLSSATKRGSLWVPNSWGECWDRNSPELRHSCVQRYKRKVEEKKNTKDSYERNLSSAKRDLDKAKEQDKKLSQDLASLRVKRNEEISKREQYIKDKEEAESKMQGMLDQKKSLDTDIEKQKAEQIKINEELAALQENAKNFDSSSHEKQKLTFEKEFQMIDSLEQKVTEYQDFTNKHYQHEEL